MTRKTIHIIEVSSLYAAVIICVILTSLACTSIKKNQTKVSSLSAKEILGNSDYKAISYGGYRKSSRDQQPSVEEIKEDLLLLAAMDIKILRTYNVKLAHAHNVLKAIHSLKANDPNFQMYVMLGAWIDCKNAWSDLPINHQEESEENASEIERAVQLAQTYPDIVKIIAVGNEAMVKWAAAYYVEPSIILKWVNYLQELKQKNDLPNNLWITSSDNFASWGGGTDEYHVKDLENLLRAVDYVSVHTYPMHDTHYNPSFWGYTEKEKKLSVHIKIDSAMSRSIDYAKLQYQAVKNYMVDLGIDKPVHIGETGWASSSDGFYGLEGSKACDEYKQAAYYNGIRKWTKKEGISCFFFEAFDEPWKDANNPHGSENHFGLFKVDGRGKYVLWETIDNNKFNSLGRGGKEICKTYDGSLELLMTDVAVPPKRNQKQ